MQYQPTILDLQSAKIASGLLKLMRDNKLSGFTFSFVEIALWYYASPIDIIPDILPGLGFVDDYLLLSTAMWLCNSELADIKSADIAMLRKQIQYFLSLNQHTQAAVPQGEESSTL